MNLLECDLYRDDLQRVIDKINILELKAKRILVTGATGLICSTIVDLLLMCNEEKDLSIHIIAASRSKDKVVARFGNRKDIEFMHYDAVNKQFSTFDYDYVIYGASNASPELYVEQPVETMMANIMGISNILEAIKKYNKNCRLVFISSSEVYGQKDNIEPFNENSYGCINIDLIRSSYAESKRAAELLCKSYVDEYGLDVCIVRPGHIYGPTATEKDHRISSEFAYRASRGHNLVMKSLGTQIRSYCYCVDCANAILTLMLKGVSGESYNIGSDDKMTIRQMAEKMALYGQVELECLEPNNKEKKVFNPMEDSSLNDLKLRKLGYSQEFDNDEGISHTIKILQSFAL